MEDALFQTGNPATNPNLSGNENALIRQAATSVANWYDDDGQADFVVQACIYQRATNDNNGTSADNPYDTDTVLADLQQQVHDAMEGAAGAYSVDTLTSILNFSHEACIELQRRARCARADTRKSKSSWR